MQLLPTFWLVCVYQNDIPCYIISCGAISGVYKVSKFEYIEQRSLKKSTTQGRIVELAIMVASSKSLICQSKLL